MGKGVGWSWDRGRGWKERERARERKREGERKGERRRGPILPPLSRPPCCASLSLPMSVFVPREAPGLKFRTENRPVSSRLLAENALPAIASRSRQGVAIRPKERGERKRGERAEDRDPSKRAFETKRERGPTLKDRRNLDSSRSACLSSARS